MQSAEAMETENCTQDTTYALTKDYKLYCTLKRSFDIILGILAIVLLSPLMIIVSIAIKLNSKGSVIFKQKRVGLNGKYFNIYKFRTMVCNAEDTLKKLTEEQKREFEKNFKLENDPRITSIGKILRKTSLDELPQLLNIVYGNMSIVGPRPIVQNEIYKYGKYTKKLFSVKPGLTGMWQANGRSSTSYQQRIRMDMYYIDNRSLWMDFKIIVKTAMSVLKSEGAC